MNRCLAQIMREFKNAKTNGFVECSFQPQCLVLLDEMGEINVARLGGKKVTAMTTKSIWVVRFLLSTIIALMLVASGCSGTDGAQGPEGPEGPEGPAGPPSEPGGPGGPPLDLEPDGLVGRILDARPLPVAGGTVYLIPSEDVETLGQTPIDLFLSPVDAAASTVDEPLDDLIDTNGDTYATATVDNDGVYRFTTIADGRYYVTWAPDSSDAMHLPGGDRCRSSVETADLVGTQLDIKVSSAASETATYVGSSTCMVCHGDHRSTRTAHRVGLQATGVRGNLQDISQWPDFDAALDAFEAGTVLNYYNCPDATSGFSKCRVSEGAPTEPGATVWFTVALSRNEPIPLGQPGAYSLTVTNVINPTDPSTPQTYDVLMTYGGAVHKQRYMTRFPNPNGTSSYYLLMVQYNYEGDISFPSSNNWPWRDYHSERWYDFTNQLLIEPAKSAAFDNNCAGCHFNGFGIEGSADDGWAALTVPDPNGAMDFDGDGRLDEINTGCEACHGPGSEHLEQRPQGGYIVSPSLLTPGRELMICGRCHSRPQGIGAGGTDAPLSADDLMALPGTRRADFALNFTQRVDGKPSSFFPTSLDSKSHHQQYSDFIRSHHYRNPFELLTCTSCHDPHGNDDNRNQLFIPADDNATCTGCHSDPFFPSIRDHITEKTGNRHDLVDEQDLKCVTCHMAGTATSGAQSPELFDDVPGADIPVSYFWGDIAGHRFESQPTALASEQPVPATNACATCHVTFLPNPPAP